MPTLEDRLRPTFTAAPALRDGLGVLLLVALTALLTPSWAGEDRYLTDVAGQIFCYALPGAMGLALAMRCGALDLSVWMVTAAGGLAGAWALGRGWGAGAALAAAGAVGLAAGAVNAVLTRVGLPSVLATALTGLTLWGAMRLGLDAREVVAPPMTEAWALDLGDGSEPLAISPLVQRIVLVAGLFCLTLGVLLTLSWWARRGRTFAPATSLAWALLASGALSGLSGAVWLVDHRSTPVPSLPVDDLRMVAAAVLGGALYFGGVGRSVLTILCVPVAMLLATIWRQQAPDIRLMGLHLQVLLLAGMVLVAQRAMLEVASPARRSWWAGAAMVACGVGLTVFVASGQELSYLARRGPMAVGLGLWLVGAVLLLVGRGRRA